MISALGVGGLDLHLSAHTDAPSSVPQVVILDGACQSLWTLSVLQDLPTLVLLHGISSLTTTAITALCC